MESIQAIFDVLNSSTCSESYHRFSPIPGYPVITDGVFMLAEAAGCYWLLDVIGSYQSNRKMDKFFQVWKLIVDMENASAVVQGYYVKSRKDGTFMNEKMMCQVYSVLDKYDKSYSNSGVLANLECWQNNKGWLVELLRHHPNWNEEALAVIFEVTHSREIDKYTINSYKYELSQLIYNLDLLEDDGTSLFSPLMLLSLHTPKLYSVRIWLLL